MENKQEQIKVSDEILAICAINATRRTEGVSEMAGGFTSMLNKSLLGRDLVVKGVKINQTDSGLEIDVHVIVRYGCKIPVVAWDIQENVKNEIQAMTGLTVRAVNINVQGVISDDKK